MKKKGSRKIRKGGFSNSYSSSGDSDGYIDFRNLKKYQAAREKYLSLAKDALSYGDRVLSENYLQHADHYLRIINSIEERNASYRNEYNSAPQSNASAHQENNVENIGIQQAPSEAQSSPEATVVEKEVING